MNIKMDELKLSEGVKFRSSTDDFLCYEVYDSKFEEEILLKLKKDSAKIREQFREIYIYNGCGVVMRNGNNDTCFYIYSKDLKARTDVAQDLGLVKIVNETIEVQPIESDVCEYV